MRSFVLASTLLLTAACVNTQPDDQLELTYYYLSF